MASTCKMFFFFVEVKTLQYLNKYRFREKIQEYSGERCSKNIYAVENENCEPMI